MGHERKMDQRETFATVVKQTTHASPDGEPMEIRSPIRDRMFVDSRGTTWLMRRGALRWSRLQRLIRDPDVPVLHVYLDEVREVPTAERESLLTRIRPYLKPSGDGPRTDDQTDFLAAEFKADGPRSMLVVEESC